MKTKNILITFFVVATAVLPAQIRGRLHVEAFEKAHQSGIPGVYDLFQDVSGMIWLGSTNGLYRYNGTEILEFTGEEKKILGKTNYSFFQEANGDVLIGSDYGLCRYHLKEDRMELLAHLDRAFDERSKYAVIGYDRDKRLWLSVSGLGLAWIKNGRMDLLKDPDNLQGFKQDRLRQGYIDSRTNRLYLSNYLTGAAVLDLNTLTVQERLPMTLSAILKVGGRLFLIHPEGILVRNASGQEKNLAFPQELRGSVRQLYGKTIVHDDSCLWISGMYGIISFNYKRDAFVDCFGFEGDPKCPPLKLICELYNDRQGTTWICSETEGIRLFNNFTQQRFHFADGNRPMTVMDIEAINDTLILVCPIVKAPCLIDLKRNSLVQISGGSLPDENFKSDRLDDSTCLLSTNSLAFLFNCRTRRISVPKWSETPAGFFRVIVNRPGEGFLLSGNRVYQFNYRHGLFALRAGTALSGVFNFTFLHDPANHTLIFSNRENSVFINDTSLTPDRITAPVFGAFNAGCSARDGSLWLATRQGLRHYDRNYRLLETWNSDNGLNNDVIYSLLFNHDSTALFLSTNRGVSRFDLKTQAILNFSIDDGVEESEHNTASCAIGKDGSYYFGNIRGVTFFKESALLKTSQKPALLVGDILVNDSLWSNKGQTRLINDLLLPPGGNNFSLRYSLLQTAQAEKLSYSYLLEGLDRNWKDSKAPPLINYSGLEPGNYLLRLRGCADGQCTEQTIAVTVQRPWHKTWWFMGFCILCGLLAFVWLAWLIAKARVRRKEKRLETERRVLEEKTRISRDLHDNVGARLSMMLNTMDWITKTQNFDNGAINELQENTRSVIQNLRETIWVMNREEITVTELSDKIKNYALQFFRHHSTRVSFDERITEERSFNSEQTLSLFRITQEVLNNILKYAGAGLVEIGIITHPESHLEISFVDNGVGFDLQTYQPGNGIINMRERADEINATFFLESGPGKGTSIRIELYSK